MNQLKGQQEFLLGIDKEDRKVAKYDGIQRRGSQQTQKSKFASNQDRFWGDQKSIRFSEFVKTQADGYKTSNVNKTYANTKSVMFRQLQ